MEIIYNLEKIEEMLEDFYQATGIYMDFLKKDFSYAGNRSRWEKTRYCKKIQSVPSGKEMCLYSDRCLLQQCKQSKKSVIHVCHAGLMDVMLPVLYEEEMIGYLIFGQLKTKEYDAGIRAYCRKIGLDEEEMKQMYAEIPRVEETKIQSVSNLAQMLAKHILLEHLLQPKLDEKLQDVIGYIEQHLAEDLSVSAISAHCNISKSVLYEKFHEILNCTVKGYINRRRVERSEEYLFTTNLSMEEIAQKVGFPDASCYSKMFKKIKGQSPLKYKKR